MLNHPVRLAVLATTAVAVVTGATLPATADPDRRAVTCPRPAGDTTVEVDFDGRSYPVLVYVPAGLPRAGRVPLVLNLHGSTSNGQNQMAYTRIRPVADANGFIVAAPNGAIPLPQDPAPAGGGWAWNVPGVPTTAGQLPPANARDDVRFLSRVIDVLATGLCTDRRRTYATGHSGGARISSALGCHLSDRIAAIAAGSGLRAGRPDPDDVSVPEMEDCRPARPVPVVTWHGQQDTVNPYQGSSDLRWGYTVPVAEQTWARLNGCRSGPHATIVSEHVTRVTYADCAWDAEVVSYRISNGAHVWPGQIEPGSQIDATRILWDFFTRFRLPAR